MTTSIAAMLALFAAPEPMALEGLIAFSDPARCEAAAPFRQLLDGLWAGADGKPGRFRIVPRAWRKGFTEIVYSIGNNGWMAATLVAKGTWHGVPLLGITLEQAPHAKAATLLLHFEAPLPQTRDLLFSKGFRFRKLEDGTDISLRPNLDDHKTTILSCEPNG